MQTRDLDPCPGRVGIVAVSSLTCDLDPQVRLAGYGLAVWYGGGGVWRWKGGGGVPQQWQPGKKEVQEERRKEKKEKRK